MTFSTYRFYVTVKILTEDILPRLSILVDDPLHEFRVEVSDFFALMVFASAGHHAHPLLIRDGTAEQLIAKGMPLGMMGGISYREIEFELQSGDVVVFMTDGIIEAKDNSGTEYQDTDRLQQVLAQFTSDTPAEAMVSALINDATAFGAGMTTEEEDDITVVVVKML